MDISFENTPANKTDDSLKVTSPVKDLSVTERIKARGERFGVNTSDEAKRVMRSEKFGSSSSSPVKSIGGDLEKMKQRGERFGENVSKKFTTMSDKEKQQSRKTRFSSSSTPADTKKIRLST